MMAERAVRKLVGLLLENGLISEAEYEDFLYVLLGDAESLLVIISILLISMAIGQIVPTVFFLIGFFSLRKRTGCYHLNSYLQCYIGTLCLYGAVTVIAYISHGCAEALFLSVLIAVAVIMRLGSVNHPNMDNDELKQSKTMARLTVVIEMSIILFLKWTGSADMAAAYLSLAIVLCAVLLVLAKLTGQEVRKA